MSSINKQVKQFNQAKEECLTALDVQRVNVADKLYEIDAGLSSSVDKIIADAYASAINQNKSNPLDKTLADTAVSAKKFQQAVDKANNQVNKDKRDTLVFIGAMAALTAASLYIEYKLTKRK